jgi:hypothetical protein
MKISYGKRALSLIVLMLLLTAALSVVALVAVDAATDGDYTYSVSGGKATITAYTGSGGAITIPSTLGGYDTVGIGIKAFAASAVTSVVIPNSLVTINSGAFSKCTALTSVTIGSSVTSIGDYAFYSCNGLTSVVIPNSVAAIGSYTFNHCVSMTSVTIGSGVTNIGTFAFGDCYSLTTVNIPSGVTVIGNYVFAGSTAMTSVNVDPGNLNYASVDGILYNKAGTTLIQYPCGKAGTFTIPSTVTSVGWAFAYSVALTAINVDPGNPSYSSIDGVLFNKANTTLIQYPDGKTGAYAIPEGTTSISSYAFFHCNMLTAIAIPINTTYIGDYAFKNCTYLSSVTFLGNVSHIGVQSFANCSALAMISFLGTVTPAYVVFNWVIGANAGLVGHAFATSNFPAPGSVFNGLMMGTYLSATPAVPGAPTGLVAKVRSGAVQLNWTAPADPGSGIVNYLVYRGTAAGGQGATPIAAALGTNYADTTGIANTRYFYVVKANNTVGAGTASNEAQAAATGVTVPSTPLSFKVTSATNQVILQWTAPADDGGSSILTYEVYRSANSGDWTKIGSVTAGTLSYVDSTGTSGASYSYYVVAINSVGKGISTTPIKVNSDDTSGGSPNNTMIFVIIGIVAVVIIMALLFLFMKRRK